MSNLKNEEIVDLYNTLCKYRENFKPEIKIENNNKNTKNEELNENDINIKTIENSDNLSLLYEDIVNFNINEENKDYTGLVKKKYNQESEKVEHLDDFEFKKIKEFIDNGKELVYERKFIPSNIGKIILEGYKRYINIEEHINIDFNEFIEFIIDEDNWVKIYNIKKDKHIFIKLIDDHSNYYYEYDRFTYFGTLIIRTDKNIFRLVLYKDINHDLYFPYERKIVKKFLGMFNINKNNLQLDFNEDLFIYVEGNNNLTRYQINQTGVPLFTPFDDYSTKKNLDKLYVLESQQIKMLDN